MRKKHKKGEPRKLTDMQKRFVKEYPIDLNITKAAQRAGFSKKTAYSAGQRLLKVVEIKDAIAKELDRRAMRTEITQDKVIRELESLAFSDIKNYITDDDGNIELSKNAPLNAMKAVSSFRRKVTYDKEGNKTVITELRLWDKPGTLKLAGKHVDVKGFSDRVELTGKDGGPVKVGITQDALDAIEGRILGEDE